ncbi:MAG: TlpA disulfide reductase family protein [Sediminibacterium sp.]|nr:TlpA disulfide reductase family protein [Sediminibacterium sp.]
MIKKNELRIIFIIHIITIFLLNKGYSQATTRLQPGFWQGKLIRPDKQEIPFTFIIEKNNSMFLVNATEKILVDDIKRRGDSIEIHFPFFGAGLVIKKNSPHFLQGYYFKKQPDKNTFIPFEAIYGEKKIISKTNSTNITGIWEVAFEKKNGVEKGVANFLQNKDGIVTGSFLTITGDYRFLAGFIQNDSLQISGFDGGFASYFIANLKNDSTLVNGTFYFGASSKTNWSAIKNEAAVLPDEYNYSHLKVGETSLNFSFLSMDGKKVSIQDDRYKGKVVIIQILGSWCPNCMDETSFLVDYYNKNKKRGVEVIGLAFEKTTDFEEAKKELSYFKKRFKPTYPILITGVTPSDPLRVEKTLPQIDKIAAFPTTIFINKKGIVTKIHTGYNGPGTGKFYADFKLEFDKIIDEMLQENIK